jgi:hypothetical protein
MIHNAKDTHSDKATVPNCQLDVAKSPTQTKAKTRAKPPIHAAARHSTRLLLTKLFVAKLFCRPVVPSSRHTAHKYFSTRHVPHLHGAMPRWLMYKGALRIAPHKVQLLVKQGGHQTAASSHSW